MDHVAALLANEVRVECNSPSLRSSLAGTIRECDEENDLCLPFASHTELADLLTRLQGLGLPFACEPKGWSPAAVFEQLRNEGLVQGKIRTIAWRGRGDAVLGEA